MIVENVKIQRGFSELFAEMERSFRTRLVLRPVEVRGYMNYVLCERSNVDLLLEHFE